MDPTPDVSSFPIALTGEIDSTAELYLELVLHRFRASGSPNAVVDLAHVTFLDARGLRFLHQVAELSRERGGQVSLLRPSARVLHLLQVATLDALFTVRGAQGDPAPRTPAHATLHGQGQPDPFV
jgi:anti-anti-sigma factor